MVAHGGGYVFVMLPFLPEFNSAFDVVTEAASRYGLQCRKADDVFRPGSVPEHILEQIQEASMCVADVSGNNPNVIHELGYAYALGKPAILISRDRPEDAAFDIRHMRIIRYNLLAEAPSRQRLTEELAIAFAAARQPLSLLKTMLVPSSLPPVEGPFVIAANPLPTLSGGARRTFCGTSSDNVGIRGLIHSFGLIYGNNRLPELVHPADYADDVCLTTDMHLYCIASPKPNRWTGLMMRELNQRYFPRFEFKPDPSSPDLQNVRLELRRNGNHFLPNDFNPDCDDPHLCDFGLIIRAPHPRLPGHLLLILAGRSSLGTQAACLAAIDPMHIDRIGTKAGLNLDDHRSPFVAFVSIRVDRKGDAADSGTLRVCDACQLQRVEG